MDNTFFGFMISELEREGKNPFPIFGNDETKNEEDQNEEKNNSFHW